MTNHTEADQPIKLRASHGAEFSVDTHARRITGLALPFGTVGESGGGRYTFSAGTLTWPDDVSRVKLLVNHNYDHAIGKALELTDTARGLLASFRVARGDAGDEALSMAADGVWDGLSVGLGRRGRFRAARDAEGPILAAVSAPVMEVSLTPLPAFEDARVQSVAASATDAGGTTPDLSTAAAILLG